jgi:hypothetical protein
MRFKAIRGLLLTVGLIASGSALPAERLVGSTTDYRVLMGLKVSQAAVQTLIPAGWTVQPAASGPMAGANLLVLMLDSLSAQDPEGKAITPARGVVMLVPVQKPEGGAAVAMVVDGIVEPGNAPGAYGVYRNGQVSVDRRATSVTGGVAKAEEHWAVQADDGNGLQVDLRFVRGAVARAKVEAPIYSAARPDFYRIYRYDHVADVVRGAQPATDRIEHASVRAKGARWASILDGSEQILGLVNIPVYMRDVYLPQ